MREIINGRQAAMLTALQNAFHMTNAKLMEAIGMRDRGTYQLHLKDLKERKLVSSYRIENKVIAHQVTDLGVKAAEDYALIKDLPKEEIAAEPNRMSWKTRGTYITPKQGFVRNNGHVHIQSRTGFRT